MFSIWSLLVTSVSVCSRSAYTLRLLAASRLRRTAARSGWRTCGSNCLRQSKHTSLSNLKQQLPPSQQTYFTIEPEAAIASVRANTLHYWTWSSNCLCQSKHTSLSNLKQQLPLSEQTHFTIEPEAAIAYDRANTLHYRTWRSNCLCQSKHTSLSNLKQQLPAAEQTHFTIEPEAAIASIRTFHVRTLLMARNLPQKVVTLQIPKR